MKSVSVYSTNTCPYCVMAKNLLLSKGYDYQEYDVGKDPQKRREMLSLSTQRTVPQIVIDGKHIGGYTDLVAYFKSQPSLAN